MRDGDLRLNAAAEWFAEMLEAPEGATARTSLSELGLTETTRGDFDLGYAPLGRYGLRERLAQFGDRALVEAGLLVSVRDHEPYDRFRGRLMIPIRNPRGRVISFAGRAVGGGEPKYLSSPDGPLFDKARALFNLDRAGSTAQERGRVLLVEGYMDVMVLTQARISEVVAPLGVALTEVQLGELWRLVPVPILCFDGDAAGRRAAVRAAQRALPLLGSGRDLRIVILPEGGSPATVIRERGRDAFEALLRGAEPIGSFMGRQERG